MIEPLLMTSVRVTTFAGASPMTGASGFFFRRDGRLHLVTSKHVLLDEPSDHRPDRLEIEIHTDRDDLGRSMGFSIPLYVEGKSVWRAASDETGPVDVATVEIELEALPKTAAYQAFEPSSIQFADERVEIGSTLIAIGYPLGFQDTLHHLPVARQASLASSFGLRFQGKGYFLVDARTHRGFSGAPVVMRAPSETQSGDRAEWKLLGIHSARLEAGTRDPEIDEALSLNSVWYADVLLALT